MLHKTILVVDDEPHIRHLLEFKLTRAGLTVLTAGTGKHAYEIGIASRPDLIVTDYQMPGMHGLELCTRLRENAETAGIPVILLTGRGHRIPAADLTRTSIRKLVAKPFSPRELLSDVMNLLKLDAPATSSKSAA